MKPRKLLSAKRVDLILRRLACQLVENHYDFSETVLIGLQPRGIYLSYRLSEVLVDTYDIRDLNHGYLDITFFRDDFRRSDRILSPNKTQIDFIVEGKRVVFVDDVFYTGRSVNAALTAIQSFGRPGSVELLTMVDRRFSRHLPIQPTYKGCQVDAFDEDCVRVCWRENDGEDAVYLVKQSR